VPPGLRGRGRLQQTSRAPAAVLNTVNDVLSPFAALIFDQPPQGTRAGDSFMKVTAADWRHLADSHNYYYAINQPEATTRALHKCKA
jgi:hypothetical protein